MLYCYKIIRDYGFAPNPFFGYCTLAYCKPHIRKYCKIGDWIAGFGGKNTIVPYKMVYLMQVSEKMTFDQYWIDSRFGRKKPYFFGSLKQCYGDNVYHHNEDGIWIQENCHHSYEDSTNYKNLNTDTSVDAVAVSGKYWYFGDGAIVLPRQFEQIIPDARDFIKIQNTTLHDELIIWMKDNYEMGKNGLPFSWIDSNGFERYKGV